MKNTKLTAAVLALMAAVVFTPSAKAALAAGDLVLGMYDSSANVANSYEVDLGTIGSLSFGETWNLGSDISAVFSTSVGSNLEYNISASGGTFGGAGGLGAKEIALTIPSTSTLNNVSATTTPSNNIVSMDSAYLTGTAIPADEVAGSTDHGVVLANTNHSSFYYEGVNPNGSFGIANSITGGDLAAYTSTASTDLYTITNATHGVETELGAFSFNASTGVLTYSAIPEPSTYALMGVGLLAFVWMMKRRASSMV